MEFLIKNQTSNTEKLESVSHLMKKLDVAHTTDVENLELTGRIPWMEVKLELEYENFNAAGAKIIF
jgi:hypothetical protein